MSFLLKLVGGLIILGSIVAVAIPFLSDTVPPDFAAVILPTVVPFAVGGVLLFGMGIIINCVQRIAVATERTVELIEQEYGQ
ncbi:MAG: hypothetical protein AAGF45_11735 [Pseudomonadota bacterium]